MLLLSQYHYPIQLVVTFCTATVIIQLIALKLYSNPMPAYLLRPYHTATTPTNHYYLSYWQKCKYENIKHDRAKQNLTCNVKSGSTVL